MRRIAGFSLAVIVAVTTALPLRAVTAQTVGSGVGQRAPAVTLRTLDGKAVDLGAHIGRTPLLLQFFAAWCSQCREQMPSYKRAIERYGKRVKFIGVAVSANQSPERARRYVRAHRLTHEILYDGRGDAVERYDVPATSYIVVINRRGRIVFTGSGGDLDVVAAAAKAL